MYDRFMPPHSTFQPLPEEDETSVQEHPHETHPIHSPPPHRKKPVSNELLGDLTGNLSKALGELFQGFSLQNLDTGDILLLLIILFLFLEGDNLDLVIALGLMLLLGLGKDETKAPS